MQKIFGFCVVVLWFCSKVIAQNVGIGTTTPDPKAALDIRATDKGVLFPSLTTVQRDAIQDPPDGLHIFNTDDRCLNYYDAVLRVWNCYCSANSCNYVVITIAADADSIDFYNSYGKSYPAAKKFVVVINPGVTIRGGLRPISVPFSAYVSRPGIDFSTMPDGITVKIINRGNIYGNGGSGGLGSSNPTSPCPGFLLPSALTNGGDGGAAIFTKINIAISVDNYGLIAGGGGGGGGGGGNLSNQYGGGGGGGAGNFAGPGGPGGGFVDRNCPFGICGPCFLSSVATGGTQGQLATGGNGGAGANGGSSGGNGGNLGQPGQPGAGANSGVGGLPGKAVGGGTGTTISNLNGGQTIGAVD